MIKGQMKRIMEYGIDLKGLSDKGFTELHLPLEILDIAWHHESQCLVAYVLEVFDVEEQGFLNTGWGTWVAIRGAMEYTEVGIGIDPQDPEDKEERYFRLEYFCTRQHLDFTVHFFKKTFFSLR